MTTRNTLREYARIGAMRRLEELRQEEAKIREAFPELFRGRRPGMNATAGNGADIRASGRKRWRMNTAQRKAVSDRMKKYWAARRKAKNG
jgi:hypothetical protein